MPVRNFYLALQAYIGVFHNWKFCSFITSLQISSPPPPFRSLLFLQPLMVWRKEWWGVGSVAAEMGKKRQIPKSWQNCEISDSHGGEYEDGWLPSDLLRLVVWYKFTDVSKVLAASITRELMRNNPEDSHLLTKLLHISSCVHSMRVYESQKQFKTRTF
jgi:hypothetical protein